MGGVGWVGGRGGVGRFVNGMYVRVSRGMGVDDLDTLFFNLVDRVYTMAEL